MSTLSKSELLSIGFESVGENPQVSNQAALFSISGRLGNNVRIDAFATLTGHIELANHVHISPFSFLNGTGGGIKMHNYSGVSTHVSVFTKSDDYTSKEHYPRKKISGPVVIGEHTILGSQCIVLPDTHIGDHCSIGIGCIVGEDIPSQSHFISANIKMIKMP